MKKLHEEVNEVNNPNKVKKIGGSNECERPGNIYNYGFGNLDLKQSIRS